MVRFSIIETQDAAWKAIQFTKNSLFYIWDKKKEISLRIEKEMIFSEQSHKNFAFFENKKYTIKISGLTQTVGLFKLYNLPHPLVFNKNSSYRNFIIMVTVGYGWNSTEK